MRCPKCYSENILIQAREFKPKITSGLILWFGGLGLLCFGVIGSVIGVIVAIVLSSILKSSFSTTYVSVMVCQSCGRVTKVSNNQRIKSHSLFCSPNESNLIVVRNDEVKGTIVNLRVWIDNEPFDLSNGEREYLKVEEGVHIMRYEQTNGLDKKGRNGEIQVDIEEDRVISFSFTRSGIKVNRSK